MFENLTLEEITQIVDTKESLVSDFVSINLCIVEYELQIQGSTYKVTLSRTNSELYGEINVLKVRRLDDDMLLTECRVKEVDDLIVIYNTAFAEVNNQSK